MVRLIDHITALLLSLNAEATSALSRSVPVTNIVRSLAPIDTPSMPTLMKSSIEITFTGISTIIQNLKEEDSKRPLLATMRRTRKSSSGERTNGIINHKLMIPFVRSPEERTNGIINHKLLYFSRTAFIASSSSVKIQQLVVDD